MKDSFSDICSSTLLKSVSEIAAMVDYMKFRDTQEIIDSRLLTSLVQKHNVEYVTKPLERRQLWLSLTKEYNAQRGTAVNHARLSKR